uniref:Stereocilin n=1 Tax=Apteryx owenii TaxID=8824 RepID=A0A8B9PK40_APTOW
ASHSMWTLQHKEDLCLMMLSLLLPCRRHSQSWTGLKSSPSGSARRDGLSSFLHNISRLLEHPEQAGEPWGPVLQPQPQRPPGDSLPRATLLRLQHILLSLRGSWHWDALLGLLHRLRSLSGAEQPLAPQPRWRLLSSLAEALGQALVAGALGPGGARLQSPRRTPAGHGGCSGGPGWLAWLLAPPQPWSPRDRRPAGAQALRPEPPWAPVGEARAEEPGWAAGPCGAAQRALEALRQRLARAAGCGLYSHFRRRVSHVRGALVHEASLALRVPHLDGDGRCSTGTLQQLLLWGFHHNISWDARALGFAAAALPAPPPLTGCLQPVPRKAAAPRGEPSLLPPVLEAVCNDSIPGLPGISNFTVYLYCNLFNSSRGSSQRPGDLGAACSDADWYLSGGSAWAWACREHFPAEFNATVCSNVSLRETPGPQQLLLEELCASLATSPSTFQELTRANASLAQPLGHPQPGAPARCQDGWSGARRLLQRLLALLPLPPGPGPAAYLLGLTSRLARCQEEPPSWVPHTNYLLRLLDLVLALSELDAAGQVAREPLSEAILLSSLMDNTSFWDLLRANASGGILRAVGRYLGPRLTARLPALGRPASTPSPQPCPRGWDPAPPTLPQGAGALHPRPCPRELGPCTPDPAPGLGLCTPTLHPGPCTPSPRNPALPDPAPLRLGIPCAQPGLVGRPGRGSLCALTLLCLPRSGGCGMAGSRCGWGWCRAAMWHTAW